MNLWVFACFFLWCRSFRGKSSASPGLEQKNSDCTCCSIFSSWGNFAVPGMLFDLQMEKIEEIPRKNQSESRYHFSRELPSLLSSSFLFSRSMGVLMHKELMGRGYTSNLDCTFRNILLTVIFFFEYA